MKRRKKMNLLIISLVVVLLLICAAGVFLILTKYYFLNKYNVYAKHAVLEKLNTRYGQEFTLISADFGGREKEVGGATYEYIWTYIFEDSQGRPFYAYMWAYGSKEMYYRGYILRRIMAHFIMTTLMDKS